MSELFQKSHHLSSWRVQLWGINAATYRVSIALKLFATFFAVVTLVVYAAPLTQTFVASQVYERYLFIIMLCYATIVIIFEAFFHFAFAAAVAMLFRKKINPLLMLAALFTMIILSLTGFEAVESIAVSLAKSSNRRGGDFVQEGLLKQQQEISQQHQTKQALIRKDHQHKRQAAALDYALEPISPNALAYDKYHARKANQLIRQQKAQTLARLDSSLNQQQAALHKRTHRRLKAIAKALAQHQQAQQKQQAYSAQQFKYISLVWAVFSILSSMLMGIYEGQKHLLAPAKVSDQGEHLPDSCEEAKPDSDALQTRDRQASQTAPTSSATSSPKILPNTELWAEVAGLFQQVDAQGTPCYSINKVRALINEKYHIHIARHQFEKVRKQALARAHKP